MAQLFRGFCILAAFLHATVFLSACAPARNAGAGSEQGFVPLFNGKDLSGWTGDTSGYSVQNGAIVCGPKGTNLYTVGEYSDFTLRLDFKLTPGANNGIGVRAPLNGDAAFEGLEIQVLDSSHEMYSGWLKPWQRHGSVYGVIAADPASMRKVGEWNSQEISLRGMQIMVTLNGTLIVDGDLAKATAAGTLDGKAHPGAARTTGHIGFLGHGDHVEYRNIRIKPEAAK